MPANSLARILSSIVLCCAVSVDASATLKLGVTFENVHGGGGGTSVVDEDELLPQPLSNSAALMPSTGKSFWDITVLFIGVYDTEYT